MQNFLGGAYAMTSQRKPAFLRGGASSTSGSPFRQNLTSLACAHFYSHPLVSWGVIGNA